MAIILGSTSAGTLGTVTLGELKAIILAEGGYDTDLTAETTLFVRDTLRRLYGMRRWSFLSQESTALSATVANAGIVDYSSFGRALMLDSVRMSDSVSNPWDLEPSKLEEVLDYRHLDPAVGPPMNWAKQGDRIIVYPIPDKTYNLKILWYGYTTLPSADGDSILWPEAHIAVVKYGAMMQLARRQRDMAGYERIKLDFQETLMEHFRDEGVEQRQVSESVNGWRGWNRFGF